MNTSSGVSPSAASSASVPCTFGASTRSASSRVLSAIRLSPSVPAAWKTPCSAPKRRRARASAAVICAALVTSACATSTSAPRDSRAATCALARAVVAPRPISTSLARYVLARCSASAYPTPPRPPVIRYTPLLRNRLATRSRRTGSMVCTNRSRPRYATVSSTGSELTSAATSAASASRRAPAGGSTTSTARLRTFGYS